MGLLRRTPVAAFGIAAGYAASLALMFVRHQWILDASGRPIVIDFLAPFTAGRMALEGRALAAYDAHIHHAAEAALVGHAFAGGLAWPYPPHFFFITATLALLSYPVAFFVWALGTLALYAMVVAKIARDRAAFLLALAPPFVLGGLIAGQNGFFTAALLGGALLALDSRRTVLCGILLGVLTVKPQFGILVPFALAAGGQWRAFFSAAATAALLLCAAGAAFGFATIPAFLHAVPATTTSLLVHGEVGLNRIQSIYGAVRWLGGPDNLAMVLQAIISLVCLGFVIALWRSGASLALKAAGLAATVVLATPYVFVYDLPFLAVALAFLYRARAFDRVEVAGTLAALLPLVAFTATPTPVSLLSALIVAALVARRIARELPALVRISAVIAAPGS
jgi:hypothetical protein